MSWDVLFQKMPENFTCLDQVPEDFQPEPLCTRAYYEKMVFQLFPKINPNGDKSWMILEGDGFSIEFNAELDDPLESLMLHVRGDQGALVAIRKICDYSGWKAIDTTTGSYIDFDGNPDAGFAQWRRFRDQVAAGNIDIKIAKSVPPEFEYVVSVDHDESLHVLKKGFNFRALLQGPYFIYGNIDKVSGVVIGLVYFLLLQSLFTSSRSGLEIALKAGIVILGNVVLAAFAYSAKINLLYIFGRKFKTVLAPDAEAALMKADPELRK